MLSDAFAGFNGKAQVGADDFMAPTVAAMPMMPVVAR